MAKQAKASVDMSAEYNELYAKLNECHTTRDLWTLGRSDAFTTAAHALSETEQTALRDAFTVLDGELKGKVKAEDIASTDNKTVVLVVDDWDFPPKSPRFPDSEFVVVKGVREDTGERFEWVAGGKRVVRHFKAADMVKDKPHKIIVMQETAAQMTAREAAPNTSPMWIVKRVAERVAASGTPF